MGQDDPLEKEMAAYSSILAWEIPWTEELLVWRSFFLNLEYEPSECLILKTSKSNLRDSQRTIENVDSGLEQHVQNLTNSESWHKGSRLKGV